MIEWTRHSLQKISKLQKLSGKKFVTVMLKRDVNFSESNKICQLSAQYLLISEVIEEIKTVEQRRFSGLCETPSTREGT